MKLLSYTAALAMLTTLPAFAGGPVVVQPELAPAPAPVMVVPVNDDWTGFSLGAELGYGNTRMAGAGATGLTYGLRAGYDQDFGNFVLGGVASMDWMNADLGADTLDTIQRLGVRGGWEMGDMLVYATAGGAWADMATAGRDNGWFAGVGAERKFNDNWSVNAELLSNQFDNFAGGGTNLISTTLGLGVNWRF